MSLTNDNISDEPTKLEKVKQHLKDNKVTYLVGAGCLTVGTAIGGAVVFRQFGGFPLEINQTAKNQALIQWKPQINQEATLIKMTMPEPIPVLDLLTGEKYRSMKRAAAVTEVAYRAIRDDVHGAQKRFQRQPDTVFA